MQQIAEIGCERSRQLRGDNRRPLPNDILTSSTPLVLRGLVDDWPLVRAARNAPQAADTYLRRFYRDATVLGTSAPASSGGKIFYNDDLSGFNFSAQMVRFDQVLDALRDHLDHPQPPTLYVGSTTIDTCLPGMREDNPLNFGARDPLASIWIGNRTCVPAHYDLPDNIACVAAGRRRFTLFPPAQLKNLYIGPLDFTPAGQSVSLVDPQAPDLARFPRYAEALTHAQTAVLEPGDALFIPSMWWHQVEGLAAFNILINYWWRQSPAYMDTPFNTLLQALMTVRDLPPAQRAAWQEIFRHYVFDSDGSEAAHIPPAARGMLAPLDADAARSLRAQVLNRLNR
ncbi:MULTISPECIES: cupin-like domain-containing protein [unclassified Duganella]|uniref:cupin-like domain-containing protein n=1 Tax=unclassified Duganella TaxID=2636909 RepID=UPI000889067C|nr:MULTISPECIES: cupin-like domain-containing protein [unclassified Duganella]SDH63827.1 Cupin-like domain-containing protein [Duganella sp. OV458]SDJ42481.1 Cupin-like domain-containing protein [Duganella sp. OV510]